MRDQIVTPPEIVAVAVAKAALPPEATSFNVTYEAGNQFLGPKKIVAESYKLSDAGATVSFYDKTGKVVLALFNFQNVVSIELNPKTGLPS